MGENQNRQLPAEVRDLLLRFDRTGRLLGVVGSPGPEGLSRDAVVGGRPSDFLPAGLAGECESAIASAFGTGEVAVVSDSIAMADGVHSFEVRFQVIDDECLAFVRDVTRSQETVTRLQRLANILEATPDVICSFSMDGHIDFANAGFIEALGAPNLEQVDRDDILSCFPEMQRLFDEAVIPEVVAKGYWLGDLDFIAGDKSAPVSTTVVAHRRQGEAPEYISIIGRDIRRSRKTEMDLIAAKEAAEAASRAKGEFLATMSHEIRTPMNGVIGAVELLLETELTEGQRDLAGTLRDSGDALLGIINDILDFSKIEAHALDLESIPFNLHDTIDGVRRVVAGIAAKKNLTLFASVAPDVPGNIKGDPARLRQILINLVANAIKFTEQGSVDVRVMRAEDLPDGRVRLRIEVVDTGIGISPEVQSRLFQSFTQADGSMSRRFGGTGLGLAISRRLATLMDGTMGVQSELGIGSTFWFTAAFRIAEIAEAAPSPQTHPASAPIGLRASVDVRLLLVEDNEVNRKIACAILDSLGYTPDVAADGFEAVRAAESNRYDAILMDCQMPGMDGLEATRRIRAAEGGASHVPIIAVTANASATDRASCLAAGMDDYLSKPLRPIVLRETVARWLTEAANRPQAEPASQPVESFVPIVNLDTMTDIRMLAPDGADDILAPLVDLFLERAREQVSSIDAAVRAHDAIELTQIAHSLKGAARNVGADQLGEIAFELEQRGRAGFAEQDELSAALRSLLDDTHAAFMAERAEFERKLAIDRGGTTSSQGEDKGEAA